jgi:hypothetical protein
MSEQVILSDGDINAVKTVHAVDRAMAGFNEKVLSLVRGDETD